MKIALIGDVHANLPALETVLEHAKKQGAVATWNVGDWVGYNAFPNEVVERLRSAGAVSIVGNYDLKALRFPKKRAKWKTGKQPEKWQAFRYAYKSLTDQNRRYLRALPLEIKLRYKDKHILLTHGSPASNTEALTPDTPEERLQTLAQMAHADVVVCGHSHRPFARQVNDVWFINTGSVGRPDDGDPRAAYALLNLTKRDLTVQHFRLAYDVERAANAIRKAGLPEAFAQMLILGCNLDEYYSRGNG
ncbi:MAG: metallophosphoesterase family protein [Anaerolineae bacterium]